MAHILKSLGELSRVGHSFCLQTALILRLFAVILILSADYEEQFVCLLRLVMYNI